MKLKILSFIFFVAVAAGVNAQNSTVVVKAGLNLANVSTSDNGSVDDAKTLAGFHVGLHGDFPLVKNVLYIQPGLLFTSKGTKTQSGNESDANYYKATTNPMYVELPVNFVFKVPMSADNTSNFFVGAGPYVAMGVAGRNKTEGKLLGVSFDTDEKIEFSDDDPTTSGEEGAGFGIMRRFDYGLNGTLGFEAGRAIFSVNYGLGLAKLQSGTDSNDDNNNKHRVLSFTVGLRF